VERQRHQSGEQLGHEGAIPSAPGAWLRTWRPERVPAENRRIPGDPVVANDRLA
jgi:hypothetical protein